MVLNFQYIYIVCHAPCNYLQKHLKFSLPWKVQVLDQGQSQSWV